MKISIITTCYNRESTISAAIESVLSQEYQNIEYILVDGASNDASMEVIEKYRSRLYRIVSEPDTGMYEALNKGIHLATGDIVGIVHSDDTLFDEKVITDVAHNFILTQADFLYGDGLYLKQNKVIRVWKGGKFSRRKVRLGWLPLHTTCFIKRELLLNNGLYDEKFRIAADTELLIRYLLDSKIKVSYLPRYIVKMQMGGLSTNAAYRKQMWEEDIRVYRKISHFPYILKICKIMWKIPQFIWAKRVNP